MRIKKSKVILFGETQTPYIDVKLVPKNKEHQKLYDNLQHILQKVEYGITTVSLYRFNDVLYSVCLKKEKYEKTLYVEFNQDYIEIGKIYDCPSRKAEGYQIYDCARLEDSLPREYKFNKNLRDFIKLVGRAYVDICRAYGIQYISNHRDWFSHKIKAEKQEVK